MPQVFRITHEAGDLSEYDSTVIDGGDLSVAAAAALVGSYGLNVLIDDTTAIYGQKNFTLLSGPAYRFRFYIDPNSLTMAAGNLFRLCDFRNSSNDRALVSLSRESGQYNIYAFVVDDASVQQGTTAQPISDTVHFVEVLIRRATGATANDGSLTLWIDGNLKQQVTGIDLFNLSQPNLARIGAVSGIDAGTSGTLYLDDFILYDDATEIGAAGSGIQPAPTPPAVSCFASTPDPILRVTDGTVIIDLLASDSGWELTDPYWLPQIAQYKGGGNYVNSAIAEGQRFVSKEYDNVVETIPLSVRGRKQSAAIGTIRELLQLGRQAADYWTEVYEFDDVWLEAKPAGSDCLTGYARVIKMQIPELGGPFGQPFFTGYKESVMEGISLVIEREPLWRGVPPGEIIGPLYNLIKNPDFELWNFGIGDSQPDSWNDLETTHITGQNSRSSDPHSGQYALKVRVSGSTLAGKFKGVSQVIADAKANTEYTVVAWVRSEGVSNGVGRILVTYLSQLEVYRSSSMHGWTLYTGKFTTGDSDTVAINCEILTTAANTDGTVYFDSLMLIEGDWEEEAALGVLPYMSSSHIVNHWDQPGGSLIEAGDINFVDVWDVPGDEDALIRIEMTNNTSPADPTNPVEIYQKVRIGQRRTQNVFLFENYHDPVGVQDTTASSNDRLNTAALNNSWQSVTSKTINGSQVTIHNQGRFRVLARVYDPKSSGDPTLQARLNYFIGAAGSNGKILDAVIAPVRAQWTMLNLTPNAAMVHDRKFASDIPGQLGYLVEMKRETGSDIGRLDYVLVMPTDGGYLDAELTPSLSYKNALIADGTVSISISGTYLRAGWFTEWSAGSGNRITSFQIYNGDLYMGGSVVSGANEKATIWRRRAGVWSQVFQHATAGLTTSKVEGFAIYNGELYATLSVETGAEVRKTSDGTIWSMFHNPISSAINLSKPIVFEQKLWLATYTVNRFIETYNGSTWTQARNYTSGQITEFAVYGGKLYAINNSGPDRVEVYDPVTNAWSISTTDGSGRSYRVIYSTGEVLLVGTGSNGEILCYNGQDWTPIELVAGSGSRDITALISFNGGVYAVEANGRVLVSVTPCSADSWESAYSELNIALNSVYSDLHAFEGKLFFGSSSSGNVYVLSDEDSAYTVSNFQGGIFTAPARTKTDPKRHRYIFSYDREGYINNVDDKAIVGIGFVPRYLALRGKN